MFFLFDNGNSCDKNWQNSTISHCDIYYANDKPIGWKSEESNQIFVTWLHLIRDKSWYRNMCHKRLSWLTWSNLNYCDSAHTRSTYKACNILDHEHETEKFLQCKCQETLMTCILLIWNVLLSWNRGNISNSR